MKKEQRKLLPIGIGIFVLYLCIRYWDPLIATLLHSLSAGIPLVIGCALAYVLNILMSLYEKIYFPKSTKKLAIKTRRPICLTGAFLTLIAIITVVVWLILPQLISCVMLLVDEVPDAINNVIAWMEERHLLTEETLNQLKSIDWGSLLNGMSTWLTSGLGSVIDIVVSTVSAVVSGIITAFLAVVFAVYLLASKEKLAKQSERVMRRYLKPRLIDRIEYVLKILNDCFHRYIVGQCTEAVILGVLCLIGMLILGLPYAAMISALTAFTALIPFAGAYIGAGVGAFMIMTISPLKALIFLIFIIVLQQLEGNLIYPRVVGSSLELPALWVLAAITVGGGMFGIIGMLLGVPFTAALYRIIKADINKNSKEPVTEPPAPPQETEAPKKTNTEAE